MISREQFATEFKLRKHIQEAILLMKKKMLKDAILDLKEELQLREVIQDLILEEVSDDPHESTAINKLETLLINIMPVLEEAYKSLTTDKAQRESFRAHILHAIRNTLAPVEAADDAVQNNSEMNEQVTIDIDAPEEDKYIELD